MIDVAIDILHGDKALSIYAYAVRLFPYQMSPQALTIKYACIPINVKSVK